MTRLIPLNIFSPVWRICHKNSKLSDSDNIPLLHNFQQPSSRTTEPYIITMKVLRLCDYDFVSLFISYAFYLADSVTMPVYDIIQKKLFIGCILL